MESIVMDEKEILPMLLFSIEMYKKMQHMDTHDYFTDPEYALTIPSTDDHRKMREIIKTIENID